MKNGFKILLVEDMESFRRAVSQLLGVYSSVTEAESLTVARIKLKSEKFDVVVLDKNLPDGDGIELLQEIKGEYPNIAVIMLTSDSDVQVIRTAINRGADDYVVKTDQVIPDLLVRIPLAVSKAATTRKIANLAQLVKDTFRYEIVGKSRSTMELRETVLSLKGTNAHVLIHGESGTGKELIARRLNSVENEADRPFIAVNCGALPENLLESELFGHKKGSFTGAVSDRAGKFELADGGDLFLDEIGEMPLLAQAKLLRAIQEGEITRVGDDRVVKVRCRIIAATNKNLPQMIAEGRFREDLYHRINVIEIQTTPLRDRRADLGDLAKVFTLQVGGPNFRILDKAIGVLKTYSWPGNIRELRNAVERSVISCRKRQSTEISEEDIAIVQIPQNIAERTKRIEMCIPKDRTDLNPEHYEEFLQSMEREYLSSALHQTNGNISDLAARLGLARSTAYKKLKDLEIHFAEPSLSQKIKLNAVLQN